MGLEVVIETRSCEREIGRRKERKFIDVAMTRKVGRWQVRHEAVALVRVDREDKETSDRGKVWANQLMYVQHIVHTFSLLENIRGRSVEDVNLESGIEDVHVTLRERRSRERHLLHSHRALAWGVEKRWDERRGDEVPELWCVRDRDGEIWNNYE